MIRRDITENERETNQDNFEKVIEGYPDYTSPVDMEEVVHNEEDREKEIIAENEDEGVIHRNIIDNKHESNWDTFDKVIE